MVLGWGANFMILGYYKNETRRYPVEIYSVFVTMAFKNWENTAKMRARPSPPSSTTAITTSIWARVLLFQVCSILHWWQIFAPMRFYKRTNLGREAFTYTEICAQKSFYTQTLLHSDAFTQKKLLHRNFCRQYAFTQRQRGFAPPSWSPIFRFPLSSSFNWAICRSSHQKVDRHTMCTGSCGRATQFSATLRVFVVIRCLDWNQLVNFWVYRDYTGIYRYIQVYLLQSKAAMPTNSVLVSWLHCISFAKIQAWTSCNFCRVADGFSRELHCTSSLSSETTVPSSNPCVAGVTVFPLAPIHPYELLAVLQAIWSPSFKSMVSFECIQWHFPLSSWHDGFRAFEFQGKLQAPESDFIDD